MPPRSAPLATVVVPTTTNDFVILCKTLQNSQDRADALLHTGYNLRINTPLLTYTPHPGKKVVDFLLHESAFVNAWETAPDLRYPFNLGTYVGDICRVSFSSVFAHLLRELAEDGEVGSTLGYLAQCSLDLFATADIYDDLTRESSLLEFYRHYYTLQYRDRFDSNADPLSRRFHERFLERLRWHLGGDANDIHFLWNSPTTFCLDVFVRQPAAEVQRRLAAHFAHHTTRLLAGKAFAYGTDPQLYDEFGQWVPLPSDGAEPSTPGTFAHDVMLHYRKLKLNHLLS